MDYIFKTRTTMKEYNNENWWIASDIISEKRITADSMEKALGIYRARVIDEHYIDISRNAIKNKAEMFADTPDGIKQVGYVITGKTEFDKGNHSGCSTQYIDLWVTILTVVNTEF